MPRHRPPRSPHRGRGDQGSTPPDDSWTMSWPNYSEPDEADDDAEPDFEISEELESVVALESEELGHATYSLAQETIEDLHWLAEHAGRDKTDLVNRAIQIYRRIAEIRANDGEIVI